MAEVTYLAGVVPVQSTEVVVVEVSESDGKDKPYASRIIAAFSAKFGGRPTVLAWRPQPSARHHLFEVGERQELKSKLRTYEERHGMIDSTHWRECTVDI
jgi:hypothetical protein